MPTPDVNDGVGEELETVSLQCSLRLLSPEKLWLSVWPSHPSPV